MRRAARRGDVRTAASIIMESLARRVAAEAFGLLIGLVKQSQ